MSLISRATLVFWIFVFPCSVGAGSADIRFDVTPPLERVRPLSDPARIVLAVSDSNGNPVSSGSLKVRLQAPEPGWLWSTDFPVIEGTQLIEMILPLSGGKAEWEYVFPIRGPYRLAATYLGERVANREKVFLLSVKENREKFVYLAGFAGVLFFFGFTAGRILTQRRSASGATRALIAGLLSVLWMSDMAVHAAEPDNRHYETGLKIAPATVGRPAVIRWHLRDAKTQQGIGGYLTLTINHLEKGKRVFSVEKVATSGEFLLGFQFTDGSDYEVAVRQELDDGGFVEERKGVSVTPVEPPMTAILPAVSLFLVLLALGLIAGRWSRLTGQIRD